MCEWQESQSVEEQGRGGGLEGIVFCRAPSHRSGSKGERQPHSGGILPRMHHHTAAGIRWKWELVHCGPAARYKTLTLTAGDQRLLGLEAREVTSVCRREVEQFSSAGRFLFLELYFWHGRLFS